MGKSTPEDERRSSPSVENTRKNRRWIVLPQYDYRQFASLLRSLRARLPASERTLAALATRGGRTLTQLSRLETTRFRARLISSDTVDALASLYRATEEEKRELLVAAGHVYN